LSLPSILSLLGYGTVQGQAFFNEYSPQVTLCSACQRSGQSMQAEMWNTILHLKS